MRVQTALFPAALWIAWTAVCTVQQTRPSDPERLAVKLRIENWLILAHRMSSASIPQIPLRKLDPPFEPPLTQYCNELFTGK